MKTNFEKGYEAAQKAVEEYDDDIGEMPELKEEFPDSDFEKGWNQAIEDAGLTDDNEYEDSPDFYDTDALGRCFSDADSGL